MLPDCCKWTPSDWHRTFLILNTDLWLGDVVIDMCKAQAEWLKWQNHATVDYILPLCWIARHLNNTAASSAWKRDANGLAGRSCNACMEGSKMSCHTLHQIYHCLFGLSRISWHWSTLLSQLTWICYRAIILKAISCKTNIANTDPQGLHLTSREACHKLKSSVKLDLQSRVKGIGCRNKIRQQFWH